MRLLVDAHAIIWAVDDPSRLPSDAAAALRDPANELLVSAGTIWEISIKVGLKKLSLSMPYRQWMDRAIADLGLTVVPITVEYADAQAGLPQHHGDPFDRLLAAQAFVGTSSVVTRRFDLRSVWSQAGLVTMPWTCYTCGVAHDDVPLCFGIEAPWRALVSESEFSQRVELNPDQCVVDGRNFFVRGHIEIPIRGYPDPMAFSVWSSISQQSFVHMCQRWEAPDRAADPPYFGWLCSPIAVYPSTIHSKLSIQSRSVGFIPLFTVEPTSHSLALDQNNGISIERWHAIAHRLLHVQ